MKPLTVSKDEFMYLKTYLRLILQTPSSPLEGCFLVNYFMGYFSFSNTVAIVQYDNDQQVSFENV